MVSGKGYRTKTELYVHYVQETSFKTMTGQHQKIENNVHADIEASAAVMASGCVCSRTTLNEADGTCPSQSRAQSKDRGETVTA